MLLRVVFAAALELGCAAGPAEEPPPSPAPAPAPKREAPATLKMTREQAVCVRLKDAYKAAAGNCALALKQGCAVSGDQGEILRKTGDCPDCDEMDAIGEALSGAKCL